jgi:hypothetical protein
LASLLDDVERLLRRFVVFADIDVPSEPDGPDGPDGSLGNQPKGLGQSAVAALWVAHAHAIDAFRISPRLLISSAEPESGKTTLLNGLSLLSPEPLPTSNISVAGLFRSIEAELGKSVFLDEAERFYSTQMKSEYAQDLTGFLNSGYRRGDFAVRCVGKLQTPQRFNTFAPLAMAALVTEFFPQTVMSRCIPIRLRTKLSNEHVTDFDEDEYEEEFDELRNRLAAILAADTTIAQLRQLKPVGLEALHNRRRQLARPLQQIAQLAGRDWPQRSSEALTALLVKRREMTITTRMLRDLLRIFDDAKRDKLYTVEILQQLNADESAPWCRWKQGRQSPELNPSELARLLAPHEITPGTIWRDGRSGKGYERAQFIDAWRRHVDPLRWFSEKPSEPSGEAGANGQPSAAEADRAAAAEPFMRRRPSRPQEKNAPPADPGSNGQPDESESTVERVEQIFRKSEISPEQPRSTQENPFLPPRKEP